MRKLLVAMSLIGLYACQSTTQKNEQAQQDTTAIAPKTEAGEPDSKNFFVVTSWATTDRDKALAHLPIAQKQLMKLWEKGYIENVYYNPKGKFNDGKGLSLVGFVIKGLSENEANQALDSTDLVKNNLANYLLRPIGENSFGRNANAIKVAAIDGAVFAVVWALEVKRDSLDATALTAQIAMNDKLQKEGILENGYIDQRSLHAETGGTQPAVYFMNAKSEAEAHKVLDAMPLVQAKQATYVLHPVGQLMMGAKDQ